MINDPLVTLNWIWANISDSTLVGILPSKTPQGAKAGGFPHDLNEKFWTFIKISPKFLP